MGRGDLYTRQGGGKEYHTHLLVSLCTHFFNPITKTSTPTTRKWIPSLTLGTTSRGLATQATTMKGGGADSSTLTGCLCSACL